MGEGGRREKEAAEGGINGKRAIAEDMRQVEGVRGTTEKSNNVRGYGKTHREPRHGKRLPVGEGKAEGNQEELSPTSPPASHRTVCCSTGLTWD